MISNLRWERYLLHNFKLKKPLVSWVFNTRSITVHNHYELINNFLANANFILFSFTLCVYKWSKEGLSLNLTSLLMIQLFPFHTILIPRKKHIHTHSVKNGRVTCQSYIGDKGEWTIESDPSTMAIAWLTCYPILITSLRWVVAQPRVNNGG